jgi:hypothetical protein
MTSFVRILPEVEGEQEVNIDNKQRNYKNSHPGRNRRHDYSSPTKTVSRKHTLSIEYV